jgi:drug/metabolite transporter (DMT)-like permease
MSSPSSVAPLGGQTKSKVDNVRVAVLAMVLTDLTLSIADAVIKSTISDIPLSQFFVTRSCITIPFLVLFVRWRYPMLSLWPVHASWAALRSSVLLLSLIAYYASLPKLDFSLAAAVYYTIPLFITLFAACLIGEAVGIRGWIGVVMGFIGVLLMLKPQTGDLNIYALLPLASAILYALGMILTRTRCRGEHPLVLALMFNVISVVLGSLAAGMVWLYGPTAETSMRFLLGEWIAMDWSYWMLVFLLSIAMLIGSVGTAFAYQKGPSSIVSTFDFSYLAFAVLLGGFFFSEQLDALTLLGIALIAGAGIVVVSRKE